MSESESDDSCKGFERLLISALAPSFIDSIAHIQTTDYILFSTFKATAEKIWETSCFGYYAIRENNTVKHRY